VAYFYIKSGLGTRTTGGGTTKQTGSMATLGATNVYNDILDAIADGVAAGDFILCSDVHNFDNGGSAISYSFLSTGIPVVVMSVDDSNIDTYSFGAIEQANNVITLNGKSIWYGVTLDTSSSIICGGNSQAILKNGKVNLTTSSDYLGSTSDGGMVTVYNTEIACSSSTSGIRLRGGTKFAMYGGSFTGTAIDSILNDSGVNGGGSVLIEGADLSNLPTYLMGNHGGAQTSDDRMEMTISRCKLHASVTFVEETITNMDSFIKVTNSSSVSGGAEYQFYYQDYFGSSEDQDSSGIVRTDGAAFDGGENAAYKITTNANVSNLTPLSFDIGSQFLALSAASTDTVRLFFTIINSATLTDSEFYAELIYPDGTTKQLANYLTNQNANPLAAGTTHTTDSASTWEDNGVALTGYNEYQMDLDTSGDPGADSVPFLRVHCGKASATVYLSMNIEAVA